MSITSTEHDTFNNEQVNNMAIKAAGLGYVDFVLEFVGRGANAYREILMKAAMRGHSRVIKALAEHAKLYADEILVAAASSGQMSVVDLAMEYGATIYNDALIAAARQGHAYEAGFMVNKGATNTEDAIRCAKNDQVVEKIKKEMPW